MEEKRRKNCDFFPGKVFSDKLIKPKVCVSRFVNRNFNTYVTVNVIKLVIVYIPRLLCIFSSTIGKSDEKQKFYQVFWLFCIIFMLNGEFEYQIDYLSQ